MPRISPKNLSLRDIRAEILVALAELYRDPLSRSQYKRFLFRGEEQAIADEVMRELSAHLLIETKLPNVVRLTALGWKLIEPELETLKQLRSTAERAVAARGFGVAPPDQLVLEISAAAGGADFVMATRLSEGRFVVDWASAGFEVITGYTVQELEAAGGWPTIVLGVLEDERRERIAQLVGGKRIAGDIQITTRAGRRLRLRYVSWPMVDAAGTRVVGTLTACRRVPRTS